MEKVKRLTSLKAPSALAVVAATGAVCASLLVVSNCSGVYASSPSFKGGAGVGRPFSPHVDDVAEHTKQRGSLARAEEEGQMTIMNHSGRSRAHRRSSSPSSSLAAGSSLGLPRSLGPIFLAASGLLTATSLLFGLGREGRRGGGGASGRAVEEEGNVEELLRTAGATSGVGAAAGLSKPLLSKNVLFSLTALGLLFLASSLAGPSFSRRTSWKEANVKTRYECTPGKCTLKFYDGEDEVKLVYREEGGGTPTIYDLELVLPPEYNLYLGERDMKDFIMRLFKKFFGERRIGSGEVQVSVPLPPGVKPEAFLSPQHRSKTWKNLQVWAEYECQEYPKGCTMTFPNSAGENANVRTIPLYEPGTDNQIPFKARLPPAFGAKTDEYRFVSVVDAVTVEKILQQWLRERKAFRDKVQVNLPMPPSLSPEIFDEHPKPPELPADSGELMEVIAFASDP